MHALTRIYKGGHLYKPSGIGELEFDPAPLLTSEDIVQTRALPGFVDDDRQTPVTYTSHHFWIHFLKYRLRDNHGESPALVRAAHEAQRKRFSGVLIRVHHGGGWEVWRGDAMLANALHRYGEDDRGAFLLCWFMIDAAQAADSAGYARAADEHRKAFIEGRLRKRKLPARGAVRVWIEPPKTEAA